MQNEFIAEKLISIRARRPNKEDLGLYSNNL